MDELKKYLQNNREQIDIDLPGDGVWTGVKKTLHPSPVIPAFAKWVAAACLVAGLGVGAYFFTRSRAVDETIAVKPATKDTPVKKTTPPAQPAISGPAETPVDPVTPVPSPAIDLVIQKAGNTKDAVVSALNDVTENAIAGHQRKTLKTVVVVGFRPNKKGVLQLPVQPDQPDSTYTVFTEIESSYAAMVDLQLERVRTQPIYAEGPEYFHLFKKQFADLAKDEEQVKKRLKQSVYKDDLLDELITIYQRKITVLKQLQFEINKMNNKVKQTDAGLPLQKPSYINL